MTDHEPIGETLAKKVARLQQSWASHHDFVEKGPGGQRIPNVEVARTFLDSWHDAAVASLRDIRRAEEDLKRFCDQKVEAKCRE